MHRDHDRSDLKTGGAERAAPLPIGRRLGQRSNRTSRTRIMGLCRHVVCEFQVQGLSYRRSDDLTRVAHNVSHLRPR